VHDDFVDKPVDAAKAALVAWCALERKDIVRCPDQPCRAGQPPEEDVVEPPVDRRLEVDDVWSQTPNLAGDLAHREKPEPRAIRVEAEAGVFGLPPRAGGEPAQDGETWRGRPELP
jgi:hypothetical protein